MDILTALNSNSKYNRTQLQLILGAWVCSAAFQRDAKINDVDGDVDEDDYTKQSIYALLYSIYSEMGTVKSDAGHPYEFTFNTWGYDWPSAWGKPPTRETDPQRFGQNAYTGLFEFPEVKQYVAERDGDVRVVELGCGTGAGANHICQHVLPKCKYTAVDMQKAAIDTCNRKFAKATGGRLKGLHANATSLDLPAASADFVVVCETHVAEQTGIATPEDEKFFGTAARLLKPGGFLLWGNAIPDSTWEPCFDVLRKAGMSQVGSHDVTQEAIRARDLDRARSEAYVQSCLNSFHGFKIPVLGARRRAEAELALKNFFRHPGTRLYERMVDGTDSYRVVLFQKKPSNGA